MKKVFFLAKAQTNSPPLPLPVFPIPVLRKYIYKLQAYGGVFKEEQPAGYFKLFTQILLSVGRDVSAQICDDL